MISVIFLIGTIVSLTPLKVNAYLINDTLKAQVYYDKALKFVKTANMDSSIIYFNKATIAYKKIKNWEQFINSRVGSGWIMGENGNYNDALDTLQHTLSDGLTLLGEKHASVASCYDNIGSIYGYLGNTEMEILYYNKALVINLALYGENHYLTARSMNNIAIVHAMNMEYDKSLDLFKKCLKIRIEKYGKISSEVAANYNNIGEVSKLMGNVDTASVNFLLSLYILEQIFGTNHPQIARGYANLGDTYVETNRCLESLKYYKISETKMRQCYKLHHPDFAILYLKVAKAQRCLKSRSEEFENIHLGLKTVWEDFSTDNVYDKKINQDAILFAPNLLELLLYEADSYLYYWELSNKTD